MKGVRRPSGERLLPFALALALFAATLSLYWPAVGFELVPLDDATFTGENPVIREGWTLQGLKASLRPHDSLYNPVLLYSFLIDFTLFGMSPAGFHFTNILLQALNGALLLLLLWRMTGAPWKSALVAALWAFHPLRVESVAWVAERKDMLSFAFLLLALWCYLGWARGRRPAWYLGALAGLALGLLCKPTLLPFPFLLLALDLWPLGRWRPGDGPRRAAPLLWEKLPFLAVSLAAGGINASIQRFGALHPEVSLLSRLDHASSSPVHALLKTAAPFSLGLRSIGTTWALAEGWGLFAAPALVLLTWLALRAARTRPYLLAGWGWYLASFFPVSGIVPASFFWTADRYTYIPHVGLFAALVWWGDSLLGPGRARRVAGAAAGIALLALLALLSARQLPTWRDGGALFGRALTFAPRDAFFLNDHGAYFLEKKRFAEAEGEFRAALAAKPGNPDFLYNLALSLRGQGRREEAAGQMRLAVEGAPEDPGRRRDFAQLLIEAGRYPEAREQLRLFLAAAPSPEAEAEARRTLWELDAKGGQAR